MPEKADDPIRQIILLPRRLCASDWLPKQHSACKDSLEFLVAPEEAKSSLGLEQLSLWTLCSRETSSSVIRRGGSGHIIVDGFQLLALSKILSSVTFSTGRDAAESTFLALMAEAFLRSDRVEMAYRCKTISLATAESNPRAFAVTRSEASAWYLHYIQRLFLLGHELGHLMLDAPDATKWSRLREDLDVRLREVRQYLRNSAPQDVRKQIDGGRWSLTGEDGGFRDELCCDTLSVELVYNAIGRSGGMDRVLICEAILACAFGLDILRLFKSVAGEDTAHLQESLLETLFSRHFVRIVYLSRLISRKFGVSRDQMEDCLENFGWAFSSSKGGLRYLFSMLEKMKQLSIPGGPDWTAEETSTHYQWSASRPDMGRQRFAH
jgi:hypothetical protein